MAKWAIKLVFPAPGSASTTTTLPFWCSISAASLGEEAEEEEEGGEGEEVPCHKKEE